VFRSFDRGGRVTTNGIDASVLGRLVVAYGCAAGVAAKYGPKPLSAHVLRRTCGRNGHENAASLLLVQAMQGHEDKTTAHYIGSFDSDGGMAIDYVRYYSVRGPLGPPLFWQFPLILARRGIAMDNALTLFPASRTFHVQREARQSLPRMNSRYPSSVELGRHRARIAC